MKQLGHFSNILRTASLLVVLLAVALSLPMSAHANMAANVSTDYHSQTGDLGADHSATGHEFHATDVDSSLASNDECKTHMAGSDCCSSMCVAAVLLTFGIMTDADEVHAHIALPHSDMASADRNRLMRPPSL